MSKLEIIKSEWQKAMQEMSASPGFRKLLNGEMTIEHYQAILRQIFHQVREHPQALALMTVNLRGRQRQMVKGLLRHSLSEVGHDQLALNDLKAMGVDTFRIPFERPLPSTSAILGFMYYLLEHQNPLSFLGYLFHLEFMPTSAGELYAQALARAGVKPNQMTFLNDHAEVDVHHNKLMAQYVDELVLTEDDLESVIYAAKATAQLYGRMITEAMESVDQATSYGLSRAELVGHPVSHPVTQPVAAVGTA
ncbi:MAG: iron-containing redox enzyme family protein [Bacteriovoracia bacterium]